MTRARACVKAAKAAGLSLGAFRVADQLVESSTAYRDRRGGHAFDNRFGAGRIEVEIDVPAFARCPRIAGRLVVHTARGASQVVSLPLAGDVGMYSHKGMPPVEGELVVGGDSHRLTPHDALALLDDHRATTPT